MAIMTKTKARAKASPTAAARYSGAAKAKAGRLDNSHSGKLRHHRHTSYGSLALLLAFMVVPLVSASGAVASAANFPTPPPVTDNYGVYGVVTGSKPTKPTISDVANGAVLTTAAPLQVRGSCASGDLIKIFKNQILAGANYCNGGSYQVSIDLFVGNNSLIARAYNANDAVSPDSSTVSVQLQLPGTNLDGIGQLNNQGAPAGQFYVTSGVTHQGLAVGDSGTWHLTVVGGQAPYAISVNWGDGKTDLYSDGASGNYDVQHVYGKSTTSGNYVIVIKASDQAGTKSYLQLATLVAGNAKPISVLGSVSGGYSGSTAIRMGWQLLATAALIVGGFWLGERREIRLLKTRKA